MNVSWQELIRACEDHIPRKQLAEDCGIPYSTLSDIANGRTMEPRGVSAIRLHDAYKRLVDQAAA